MANIKEDKKEKGKGGFKDQPNRHRVVRHGADSRINYSVGISMPATLPKKGFMAIQSVSRGNPAQLETQGKASSTPIKINETTPQEEKEEPRPVYDFATIKVNDMIKQVLKERYDKMGLEYFTFDEYVKLYENGLDVIKTLTGNEYVIPRYKIVENENKDDRKQMIKDDIFFNDLPINDMFSVMDVVIPAVLGVNEGELIQLAKEGKYDEIKKKINEGRKNAKNVLLVGPTGTGKTTFAKYLAKMFNQPFARIPLSKITVDDLVGHFDIQRHKLVWVDGLLTIGVKRGWIVLLDEINAAKPDVLFALHTLTDDERALYLLAKGKKGTRIDSHEKTRVLAAMNVGEAYTGTQQLNAAFLDRFEMIPVNYLTPDDERIVISKRLNIKPLDELKKEKEISPTELLTSYSLELLLQIAEYTRTKLTGTEDIITGSGEYSSLQVDVTELVPLSTRRLIAWLDILRTYYKVQEEKGALKNLDTSNIHDIAVNTIKASMDFIIKTHYQDETVQLVLLSRLEDYISRDEFNKIKENAKENLEEAFKKMAKI